MATNPGRTGISMGIGMGMGIEYGKPAPYFEQKQKQDGVATNLERTDIGMNMGTGDGKPAPLLKADLKKRTGRGGHQPRAHGHWHGHGHRVW